MAGQESLRPNLTFLAEFFPCLSSLRQKYHLARFLFLLRNRFLFFHFLLRLVKEMRKIRRLLGEDNKRIRDFKRFILVYCKTTFAGFRNRGRDTKINSKESIK